MPQSLAQIYLHIVFSTKERRAFLQDPAIRDETHKYLGGQIGHGNGTAEPTENVDVVGDAANAQDRANHHNG